MNGSLRRRAKTTCFSVSREPRGNKIFSNIEKNHIQVRFFINPKLHSITTSFEQGAQVAKIIQIGFDFCLIDFKWKSRSNDGGFYSQRRYFPCYRLVHLCFVRVPGANSGVCVQPVYDVANSNIDDCNFAAGGFDQITVTISFS